MTAVGMKQAHGSAIARPVWREGLVRQILLACGIVASLLYVATDVLGGLHYEGYSFTSQAVSELMAVGAPSEDFVDPLFMANGMLTLAFAIGVVREAAGRNRALRVTGALLIPYSIVGLTGPTLFEMHPRGAGSVAGDMPHIVVTGVLVALTLLAIGFGAFGLGKRFRIYSFATLVTVIALGAASARYGALIAAGQPTPGFGIIERILIYSSMLWFGVLAVALLRRPSHQRATAAAAG